MAAEIDAKIQVINEISPDLANIIYGLYTDLPPKDNDLIVDLNWIQFTDHNLRPGLQKIL